MNYFVAQSCMVVNMLVGDTPFCPSDVRAIKLRDVWTERFMEHCSRFGLSFATKHEFDYRFAIFVETEHEIERINQEPGNTFKVGHNMFSTMTELEKKRLLGEFKDVPQMEDNYTVLPVEDLADSVDWRAKGVVNPVQDQGQCGSCWTFAAAAAMESRLAINTGKLVKLSEQQFVDCDDQCAGCQGGLARLAFDYAQTHPVELESDYPYKAANQQCTSDATKGRAKNTAYTLVTPSSMDQLVAALNNGPVSVSVAAGNNYFRLYTGGVLNNPACGKALDHAIVAVGYGTDADTNTPYYIVRNSWGTKWGEAGYIRMARVAGDGQCGIQIRPVWPNTVDA